MKSVQMLVIGSTLALIPAVSFALQPIATDLTTLSPPSNSEIVSGIIKSVNTGSKNFELKIGEGKADLTISVNEKTSYLLNGNTSTMEAALKQGNTASVTHRLNIATAVDAKISKAPPPPPPAR